MPIKQKLNVLEIDRPLKQGETAIDIFTKHLTQYDLILFPAKENDVECRIQCVSAKNIYLMDFQRIFSVIINNGNGAFYDFDTTEIDQDVFYEILETLYAVEVKKLTEIEKNN